MNAKRTGLMIAFLIAALLMSGCGTDTKDELKPPGVYKNPQVKITHAPTELVVEQPTAEASPVATDAVVSSLPNEVFQEPELDDQFYLDNVESLLNQIENELERLERMDKNP